jgi:BirA family biotin operon repressor/biotin-[acetyl-CoA-carboxylase] ligase
MRREGRLFAPALVLTANQTAGRGRGGNTWFSTAGVITVTFVLPVEEALAAHQLPLLAGLAVRHAAAELAAEPAIGLKWPNDLYHAGRKLAGLLCQRIEGVDLVGLGLNVNLQPLEVPAALRKRATSLSAVAGRKLDLTDSLLAVARHISQMTARWRDTPFAALLREYERHHILRAREVAVHVSSDQPPVVGVCEGLDEMGRLVVRGNAGRQALIAGHVELL